MSDTFLGTGNIELSETKWSHSGHLCSTLLQTTTANIYLQTLWEPGSLFSIVQPREFQALV